MSIGTWTEICSFVLGAILGSFLNAVIYRVPRRISLNNPRRSFCPNCNKQLTWIENVPMLSWLWQRGRCRSCKEPIPVRYFVVELLSAIAGLVSLETFGLTPTGAVVFALVLTLIAISFIDLDHKIIPDRISFPGMVFGLLLGIVSQYTPYFRCQPFQQLCPITQSATESLLGFISAGGFFWLIGWLYYVFTKRDGLGFGDVKLMGMLGGILGLRSVFPTIILGSLSGAIVGVAIMLLSGTGRQTEIPFGPWLSLGAIIYIFFDPAMFQLM